jgi:hypothetical protein
MPFFKENAVSCSRNMLGLTQISWIIKRGALIGFLFFIGLTVCAQGFNTVYENPLLPDIGGAEGLSIHYWEDTLYVGGGIVQEDQRGIGIFLKYNLEGECLDTLLIPSSNDSMNVNIGRVSGTQLTSSGIVVPLVEFTMELYEQDRNGDSLGLLAFNGEFLWKTSLHVEEQGSETFHQVRSCSDGYYVIGSVSDTVGVLSADNVQGLLIRTDLQGNMLWHRRFFEVSNFDHIIVLEDDQVILGGITRHPSNGAGINNLILRADAQGNELWRYDFGGNVHDGPVLPIVPLEGDRILVFANMKFPSTSFYTSYFQVDVIQDLSDEGFLLESSYTIDTYPLFKVLFHAIRTSDGGALAIGRVPEVTGEHPAYAYGFLLKTDQMGDSLWARSYTYGNDEESNFHWFNSVAELADHGFAMAGRDERDSGLSQIWVMRVDSMGCLEPGCHLVSGLQEQVIGLDGSMKVFPNPVTSGQPISLQFKPQSTATMPYNREATRILLYDLQGRLFFEEKIAPTGSNEGFILNLSLPRLSTGTYSLHWISEKGVWYDGEQLMVE